MGWLVVLGREKKQMVAWLVVLGKWKSKGLDEKGWICQPMDGSWWGTK